MAVSVKSNRASEIDPLALKGDQSNKERVVSEESNRQTSLSAFKMNSRK